MLSLPAGAVPFCAAVHGAGGRLRDRVRVTNSVTRTLSPLRRSIGRGRRAVSRYDAFLSYSHAADDRLAPAIQSGLQRLAKPFYRRRALNVFRDKTGLAAGPALWRTIEAALERSDYFILLASPESAHSEWVEKEVGWWLQHRGSDKLLVVLTGGELAWDDTRGDLDWQLTSALPDLLHGALREEPLYVDLRWAREVNDLNLRNTRFLDAILDLASPLHGRAKNDLAGEEVRQGRIVRAATGTAATIFAVLALVAWHERGVAVDKTKQAVTSQHQAEQNAVIAATRQRLAEQRLKQLCSAWSVAVAYVVKNVDPGAIYDIKAELYSVFPFDDNCP